MNAVINFHRVTDGKSFDAVIRFLASKYELVPIDACDALCRGHAQGDKLCHITVDDGDKSFCDVIAPILSRHRVSASLFVSPRVCSQNGNYWFQEIRGYKDEELKEICAGMLGVPSGTLSQYSIDAVLKTMSIESITEVIERYQKRTGTPARPGSNMTVSDLKDIDALGLVSVGAHTMSHPILQNENDARSEYEIAESISELAALLKHEIRYFAYPNGIEGLDFGQREETILRKRGIRLAFTTESRHLSSSDDAMRIPRIQVGNRESMLSVKAKLALGSGWNMLKRIKGTGEYAERKRLGRLTRRCA